MEYLINKQCTTSLRLWKVIRDNNFMSSKSVIIKAMEMDKFTQERNIEKKISTRLESCYSPRFKGQPTFKGQREENTSKIQKCINDRKQTQCYKSQK
jgi:hypothetical protein